MSEINQAALIDVIEDLTEEQRKLAIRRAKHAFQDCVVDYESEEFIEEFEEQVKRIATTEDLESLVRKGMVEIIRVLPNGEYDYKITAKGEQVCRQMESVSVPPAESANA